MWASEEAEDKTEKESHTRAVHASTATRGFAARQSAVSSLLKPHRSGAGDGETSTTALTVMVRRQSQSPSSQLQLSLSGSGRVRLGRVRIHRAPNSVPGPGRLTGLREGDASATRHRRASTSDVEGGGGRGERRSKDSYAGVSLVGDLYGVPEWPLLIWLSQVRVPSLLPSFP